MLSSKTVSARDLALHCIEVEVRHFVSLTRRTLYTNLGGDEGEQVGRGEHDLSAQIIKLSFALQF